MNLFDDALGDLDAYAEELNAALPVIERYTKWATRALADLTAVACELSPSKLDQMEARYEVRPSLRSAGHTSTFLCLRTYPALKRATDANIAQLRSLGCVPYGAGLAAVTQGVIHPDFARNLGPLAQDWRDAGLRFPLAPFTIWTRHVSIFGGAA